MSAEKPTLEQFGAAVDLAGHTLQILQVPFTIASLREVAQQIRGIHRSQEIGIGIEPDIAVLATDGLAQRFDASQKGRHAANTVVHPDITESILQAERHPFGQGLPLYNGNIVVARVFGIPSRNGNDAVHGYDKWLDEQLRAVQSGLGQGVVPMNLQVYFFEQAQRREAGLKPLDNKTRTRFPQCYALERSAIGGVFVSPYAKWDKKTGGLIIDKSDTHPHSHTHYRSMLGRKPVG